jgi:hypothetical protein
MARYRDANHAHTHSCLQTSQRFVRGPRVEIMSNPHSGHSSFDDFDGFFSSSSQTAEVDFALLVFRLEDWR